MVSRWIFLFSSLLVSISPQFDPIQPKNSLIHQKEEEGGGREGEEGKGGGEEGGITERLTFKKIADIERPKKFRTPVSRLPSSGLNRIHVSFTTLVFVRRRKPLQSAPPSPPPSPPLHYHYSHGKENETRRRRRRRKKERLIEKEEKKG